MVTVKACPLSSDWRTASRAVIPRASRAARTWSSTEVRLSTTGVVAAADELPVSTATAVGWELRTAVSQVFWNDSVANRVAIWARAEARSWLGGAMRAPPGLEGNGRWGAGGAVVGE